MGWIGGGGGLSQVHSSGRVGKELRGGREEWEVGRRRGWGWGVGSIRDSRRCAARGENLWFGSCALVPLLPPPLRGLDVAASQAGARSRPWLPRTAEAVQWWRGPALPHLPNLQTTPRIRRRKPPSEDADATVLKEPLLALGDELQPYFHCPKPLIVGLHSLGHLEQMTP